MKQPQGVDAECRRPGDAVATAWPTPGYRGWAGEALATPLLSSSRPVTAWPLQTLYRVEQNLGLAIKDVEGFPAPPVLVWSTSGSAVCAAIAESSESGLTAQSPPRKCNMPETSNRVYNPLQFLALLELEKLISMNFPDLRCEKIAKIGN